MFKWQEKFSDYLVSSNEAVSLIKNNDYIVVGMIEPKELMDALSERDDLKNVSIYCAQSLCGRIGTVALNSKSGIKAYSSFIDPAEDLMKAHKKGLINFIPASFSSWHNLNSNYKKCDVVMLAVSPPDERGFVTCASYPEQVSSLIDDVPILIGEINETLPTTYGDPHIHISKFTKVMEAKSKWKFLIKDDLGDYTKDKQSVQMGGYLSELIEDGSTIEIGVGSMNGNALLNMENVKNLGVHTEYFGIVMMELMKKGVVNNSQKNIDKGYSVATIGSGSEEFYRFIHKNPEVRFMPAKYIMDIRTILQNPKVVAINNAAQVDLLGQVNGEYIKGLQYSGIGGQGDFAKAATLADDGKSIIAMASTTSDEKHSKIVPFFPQGTPVTTPRTDVEYIVTEYGIAQMAGQTTRERAINLIKITHPKFRDELEEKAKQYKLI